MKKIMLSALVLMTLMGCASTATKNAINKFSVIEHAYAQVVEVYDADRSSVRSVCTNLREHKESQKVCANLKDYNIAKSTVLRLNRWVTILVAVPKGIQVEEDYFLEINPSGQLASFKRVASRGATENCRWDGPIQYKTEDGAAGRVVGFVGGMLIVPAIIGLGSDEALSGGVICNGWTYKSLIHSEV